MQFHLSNKAVLTICMMFILVISGNSWALSRKIDHETAAIYFQTDEIYHKMLDREKLSFQRRVAEEDRLNRLDRDLAQMDVDARKRSAEIKRLKLAVREIKRRDG
jgi:hypothetical protein